MKRTILLFTMGLLCLTITSLQLNAQAPEWQWAKSAGDNGYDYGTSVGVDFAANSYIIGYYAGTIVFDENHSFTSSGSSDIFIAKYDWSGAFLWAQSFGGSDGDFSTGISVDYYGNFMIAGYFKSATFTIGNTTLTNAGGNTNDAFVARFDRDGNLMWAESVGGTGDDRALALVSTDFGICYLTGYFVSPVITFGDFQLVNTGATDIFITRLEPDGSPSWAFSAAGTSFDYPRAITVDRSDNCYIAGDFNSGTLAFGPIILDKNSNNDIFLAKLNSSGVPLWAVQAGVNSDNSATAVTVDTLENVYIAGSFKSTTLNFGTITLTNSGFIDIFLAKYNAGGVPVWAMASGGSEEDAARSLTIDRFQDVYMTGYYKSASINIGENTLSNVSPGTADLFVTEITSDQEILWTRSAGGTGDEVPYYIDLDANFNFIITGYFSSPTLSFGSNTLTCNGSTDAFLTKSNNILHTGILEPGSVNISVYPNPASESVIVSHPEGAVIEVCDLQGKILKEFLSTSEESKIEIGSLNKGVYFVKIITDKGFAVSKFVKQ